MERQYDPVMLLMQFNILEKECARLRAQVAVTKGNFDVVLRDNARLREQLAAQEVQARQIRMELHSMMNLVEELQGK